MNLNEILSNDPQKRNISQITKIYHGLCNCCRCGCGGSYFEKDTVGFKRAINKMLKPDFKPLSYGEIVYAVRHNCNEKSEGIVYGGNYIDIPYNVNNDKCYCLYFD